MRSIKFIITKILCYLTTCVCLAQNPGWSIQANKYQYTMTMVAFLNVDGNMLTLEQDKIAAFVDDEVRGVASPALVTGVGRHLVYLTMYANKDRETVTFKIYDSARDRIIHIDKTVVFEIDKQYGNAFQAFSLASPPLRNGSSLIDLSFVEAEPVSRNIGEDEVTVLLPYATDIRSLAPLFTLSEGARLYYNKALLEPGAAALDFSGDVELQVMSEDESILRTYKVNTLTQQPGAEGSFTCTNVITANNDGANDKWIVQDAFLYDHHTFRILDVNGRVIYESVGYRNDWDGTRDGKPLERGKYFYVVEDNTTRQVIQGNILVLY